MNNLRIVTGEPQNDKIGTSEPQNDKNNPIQELLRNFFFSFPPDQVEDIVSEMFDLALSSELMDGMNGNQRLTLHQFKMSLPKLMNELSVLT